MIPCMARSTCVGTGRTEIFVMKVTIPANTTATVRLPALDPSKVTEGDRPLADSPGIKQLGQESNHLSLRLESGSYEFHSTW